MINYLQNEDLCSIGVAIAEHLAKDEALNDFCHTHFGEALNLFVGPHEAALPSDNLTPYVFVHDLSKAEGAAVTEHKYQCVLSVGISCSEENATTDSGVIVFAGQQRTSELMTLIQDALNRYDNGCNPPGYIEQSIPSLPGNNPDHWEGFIVAQWVLSTPIGRQNHF